MTIVTATADRRVVGQRAKLRWFFPVASGLLLVAMLVGFARTFFLRAFFDVPPMPAYLYVHGLVLTAWFVLVFVQTVLVAARRTSLHRRLGVSTAVVGALLVPVSAFVAIRAVPRLAALGAPDDAIVPIVFGDLLALTSFVGLVGAALYLRKRPDFHKRFMLASCLVLFGPINARLARLGVALPLPVMALLPVLVLAIYDVIVLRRLHPATWWTVLVTAVVGAGVAVMLVSGLGQTLIAGLK